MRESRWYRGAFASLAFLSGLLLGESRAMATTLTVTMTNGTIVSGEIEEYIRGDHVTLRLATGEVRRIAWADIVPEGTAPPPYVAPPPPPRLAPPPPPPIVAQPPAEDWTLMPSVSPVSPLEASLPRMSSLSRLSLGVETGYGSTLGDFAFVLEYFPVGWMGFSAAVAAPIDPEPVTASERVFFEWRLGRSVTQGSGIGMSEAFVSSVAKGGHAGTVTYLTLEATHFTFFMFSGRVSLRLAVGLSFAVSNGDYCTEHPGACPQIADVIPYYGSVTLLHNFDLSRGTH